MIWNPYALNLHGVASPAAAPPVLQVLGGQASATQLAMAQSAFARFCTLVRTSPVPNPMQSGRLPDGTPYRITVVGNTAKMTLWPAGAAEAVQLGYLIRPADKTHGTGWMPSPDALVRSPAKASAPWKTELHSALQAGAVNWFGSDGRMLSWNHGYNNRYGTHRWDDVLLSDDVYVSGNTTEKDGIFYRGVMIETPAPVWAAAVFSGKLVFLCNETLYWTQSPLTAIDAAWRRGGTVPASVSPAWASAAIAGDKSNLRKVSAWHFAPSGAKAACATVIRPTVGWGSWSLYLGCTQALPQSKLYVSLSLNADGSLSATFSEQAFAGQAWSTMLGAQMVYRDVAQLGTGFGYWPKDGVVRPLVHGGLRLWGVDFDASGAEIEVTCRRIGQGSATLLDQTVGLTAQGREFLDMDVRWGVYANERPIFEVSTTVTYDLAWSRNISSGATSLQANQYGKSVFEYVSLHELDARFCAAVLERMRVEFAGGVLVDDPVTGVLPYLSAETITPVTSMEWVFEGESVFSEVVPPPNFVSFRYRMTRAGAFFFGKKLRRRPYDASDAPVFIANLAMVSDGPSLVPLGPSDAYDGAAVSAVTFPQTAGRHGENIHSDTVYGFREDAGGIGGNTIGPPHLSRYPNQITDALVMSTGQHGMDFLFSTQYQFWFRLFGVNQEYAYPLIYLSYLNAFNQEYVRGGGFARSQYLGNHYAMTAKNGFMWAFYRFVLEVRMRYLGGPPFMDDYQPSYAAALFTRADADSAYERRDLMAPTLALVEQDAGSVHSATFHLDPVRAL